MPKAWFSSLLVYPPIQGSFLCRVRDLFARSRSHVAAMLPQYNKTADLWFSSLYLYPLYWHGSSLYWISCLFHAPSLVSPCFCVLCIWGSWPEEAAGGHFISPFAKSPGRAPRPQASQIPTRLRLGARARCEESASG